MKLVDRYPDENSPASVDQLLISLRAYVTRTAKETRHGQERQWRVEGPRLPPTDWVLVFDCETRTTPDQHLRFGAYQLRHKGRLFERGIFYDPDILAAAELALLRMVHADEQARSDGERIRLLTRAAFVDDVFYKSAFEVGAQIVGFNLPFDLSRLAIEHASARGSMRGGFSLKLSGKKGRPRVAVKHLSQRAAMIRFTGSSGKKSDQHDDTRPVSLNGSEKEVDPDRGYFVDVKTLAAALTSQSHSLESLSGLLRVSTPKAPSEQHGGPLTADYIRYGMRDVQTTWECFDVLAKRFESFGLEATGLYDLYSEASLGKAYLKSMNIASWRNLQSDFPPEIVGQVLSTYYGGRAEVHIRRQIVQVIHCDFLSMYPTVCTLMGLWWTAAGPVDKPRLSFEHRRQLVSTQRFTPEFKEEAVKQVKDRGYGVPEVAARIGVSAHSLYKWVKAASPDKSEQQSKELLEAKSEILRLRAQVRRVEEERDLLKKAARYFAREPE